MRGRGRQQSKYPDKQLSCLAAKNQLLALLTGCTDERLASFTVDGLCRMYRVQEREIEYHLTIERQNRTRAVSA
ncbi:hypothetical protein [Sphingomonas koreensis]